MMAKKKGKIKKSWRVTNYGVNNGHSGMAATAVYNCDYEQKHKNHIAEKCDRVFKLYGNPDKVVALASRDCEAVNLKNKMAGKGGRPIADFGRQFQISFPKGMEPKTDEQWRTLARDVLTTIAKKIKVRPRDLGLHSYGTVHMNKKNPHMDIVISKSINKKIYSNLNSAYLTNAVRAQVNLTMTKMGVDFSQYNAIGKGHRQRWQYEQAKQKEAENTIKQAEMTKADLRALKKFNTLFSKELMNWFKSQDEQAIQKSEKKMAKLFDKAEERFGLNVLDEMGPISSIEEAEEKKKRKTGLKY